MQTRNECTQRERDSERGESDLRHGSKNNYKILFFSICGSTCHVKEYTEFKYKNNKRKLKWSFLSEDNPSKS